MAALETEHDLTVVAEAGADDDLVPVAERLTPDVAVVGLEPPGHDRLAAVRRLHERVPGGRALILSRNPPPGQVRRALAAHALGFMRIDVAPAQLTEGIRRVAQGRRAVDPELAVAALESADNPLTRREMEVLRIAAQGAQSREIAEQLFLSVGTVRNHLSRIMCKIGARNRLDAVRIATEAGWL